MPALPALSQAHRQVYGGSQAAERSGADISTGCLHGSCGVCEVELHKFGPDGTQGAGASNPRPGTSAAHRMHRHAAAAIRQRLRFDSGCVSLLAPEINAPAASVHVPRHTPRACWAASVSPRRRRPPSLPPSPGAVDRRSAGGSVVVRACIAKVPKGYPRLELDLLPDDMVWGQDGFDT